MLGGVQAGMGMTAGTELPIRVEDASGRFDSAATSALEAYTVAAAVRIIDYLGPSSARDVVIVIDPERRIPYAENANADGTVTVRLPASRLKPDDIAGSGLAIEHELTHAIAPGDDHDDRLLVEGLAVHVQDFLGPPGYPDFEQSPHETVIDLERRLGTTIPLAQSEKARLERESGDERRLAYAQEGSFVRWLIETRGLRQFLVFYRDGADYRRHFDRTLAELETDWRAFLASDAGVASASKPARDANRADALRSNSPNDAGIRSFWSSLDTRWAARAAKPFSELFAVDGNFVFVDRGQRLDGRQAIHDHFLQQFPRIGPELVHRTTVHDIERIADGIFAVDGTVRILRTQDAAGGTLETLKTFAVFSIMLESDTGWRIRELRAYELLMVSSANE